LCRNCPLKHVIGGNIEGRIEVEEKRRRRRKQLLYDLEEMREYWKLKENALDRTLWRTGYGRGKIFIPSLVTDYNTKMVTVLSRYVTCSKQ
jgi:hypothetical protein